MFAILFFFPLWEGGMEFVHNVEAELCLQEGIAAAAVCPVPGVQPESPGAGPWGALGAVPMGHLIPLGTPQLIPF